jgi:oligosaccharide repeat unit polymerase
MALTDISFVIIFILFPIFACVLLRTAGLSIFRLSIPSVVIVSLFVFAYIGILPMYFQWVAYLVNAGVTDKTIILQIFLYISISIFGIIIGYCIAYNILKRSENISLKRIFIKPGLLDKLAIIVLLTICATVIYFYLKQIPQIALFVAINNSSVKAAASARSSMVYSFSGKYHRYSVFMQDVLNIISFSLFALCLQPKKNIFVFILFIMTFCLAVFSSIVSINKAPIIYLIMGHWFIYLIIKKDGKIPIKDIIIFGLVAISILIPAYIMFIGSTSPLKAFSNIFSRAFVSQIEPAYYYLQYFPIHHEYLMGMSFSNPGHLLPYTPFDLALEIFKWKSPEVASTGVIGSYPTAFWGEMYANFGIPGICIPPVFIGIILFIIQYLLGKLKPNHFIIGLYAWFMLYYSKLALNGLSGFFVDFFMIVVLIVFCFTLIFTGMGKILLIKEKKVKDL